MEERLEKIFSFEGRIGRGAFWLTELVVFVGYVGLAFLIVSIVHMKNQSIAGALTIILPVGIILLAWLSLASGVKRYHDRGKSGWWMLISLIPFIGGIWMIIELGFLPGTPGPNDYSDTDERSRFAKSFVRTPDMDVSIGQSTAEVKQIMGGEPDTITEDDRGRLHYRYRTIEVMFRDDKAVGIEYLQPKKV